MKCLKTLSKFVKSSTYGVLILWDLFRHPKGIIELEHKAYWALKHVNFDLKTAGDHRKLQLNELNELRDQAYENSLIYKEKTKKLHDSKIKNRIFNVGDQVLLFNSRLKIFSGKLKTRWSGPFTIAQVFPYGTVELSQPDGPNFKVNGHRVKHYFGGDIPPKPRVINGANKNWSTHVLKEPRYGYMKNHMKTVKNGQTRTQERKSEQKPEAKARKSQIYSQLQSILVNRSQQNLKYSTLALLRSKGRVVVQNVQGRQNRGQGNNARGGGAAGYGGAQNKVGNANPGQARQIKCYNCNAQENGVALDEEQLLFLAGGQDNAIDEDMDEQPVQDLALNVDNVFQVDDCDAFDSDVDEAPTVQTMFMANISSADPVYDEAGPSYDSNILSEVHDNDHYQDAVCEHHEEHEMHDYVQPTYVVDSHADYTSDSNMIPYDQYVKDNAVPVVQSNVYYVPNDAYMMIFNDMHEPHAQSVSNTTRNTVVDNSLTPELATYKEQAELYERRARFKLMERKQKIDKQLRIVITDRNIKKENLKKELHSVKMQLASTINHNKSMVEEVTSLKNDFKQKENKYLE
ncbi:hypothetical protein Tco_0826351 [Tanacetum coccineum]